MSHPLLMAFLALFLGSAWAYTGPLITRQAQLSAARDGVGGVLVEDLYYFAGGFELHDYIPTNVTEIFNMTSREWEEPIYLEEPRGFISTAVIGQNIYFIGGAQFSTSIVLYSPITHQYEDIGCGTTVRQATQVSNHNSTVTVLGGFSADFYDASTGWYYRPKLTSWMQGISGRAKAVHENLVIGVGGVNTTTLEDVFDAWIYDTATDNLTVFSNVTTGFSSQSRIDISAANGRFILVASDRYFAHVLGTTEWREVPLYHPSQAVVLNDVAFVFNISGYSVYDWSSKVANWTDKSLSEVFQFENQLVIRVGATLDVYQDGTWTTIVLDKPVTRSFRWFDKQVLYDQRADLQVYDSKTKTISIIANSMSEWASIVAIDPITLVLFAAGNATIYNAETQTFLPPISVNFIGEFAIGSDIISLTSKIAWVNFNQTVNLNTIKRATPSEDHTVRVGHTFPVSYGKINVYNYVKKIFLPTIDMQSSFNWYFFAPVAVINDMLVVMLPQQTFRYNTTSGDFSMVTESQKSIFQGVNTVPVVDNTAYVPGLNVSSIVQVSASSTSVINIDSFTEGPWQFVNQGNVIHMVAAITAQKFEKVFTFDINTQTLETYALPASQQRLTIALVDSTLVTLGSDGYAYAVNLNDKSLWYSVRLDYQYSPSISLGLKDRTIMVASGHHHMLNHFTDQILFINASVILESDVINLAPVTTVNATAPTYTNQGLTDGELAAAIVVPIVVAGGAVALIVLLLRRKRKSSKSNTIGLESRYGAWFTPFDQITFGEQLGQGASGQVFKGTWKNTTVALKVSMTQANTSVIAELELMMQLRPHPNVVQLLGFSVHPETDSIILIIEFCEGGSLDAKLYDEKAELSFNDQLQWLAGIAKGLSHLHSNNIVHRDIAARNVLIDRNEPKLTDFGMSRLVDEQKQHGTTKSELGPIRWMSPESLKNKEYSTKSDIWSFGILIFEVIARQEPHSEADPIEIGRLIRDSGLTPVIPSSCHPQLADVMKQCWQMSPQSRPKIESIIESLESIHSAID